MPLPAHNLNTCSGLFFQEEDISVWTNNRFLVMFANNFCLFLFAFLCVDASSLQAIVTLPCLTFMHLP